MSYNDKHNEDNGEDNRDGHSHNLSYNYGTEGPTDDPAILTARRKAMRNLLGTLLLSAGIPMLTAGDEVGRSQRGNNNAYAQDNALTWLDWEGRDLDLEAHVADLARLRRALGGTRPLHPRTGRAAPPHRLVRRGTRRGRDHRRRALPRAPDHPRARAQGAADLLDVREVDLWVHALGQQVQPQGHQVHVAGALAVAEQAALDAVGAGHEAELGGGHARAAVVVVVQGQAHGVTVGQVSAHPLERGDFLQSTPRTKWHQHTHLCLLYHQTSAI